MKKENLSTRFLTVQDLQNEIEKEKKELETLKEKETEVENELKKFFPILEELQKKKSNIQEKIEALQTRTSSLAKNLLKEVQKEQEKIAEEISFKEQEKNEIQHILDSIQKDIKKLDKNIKQKEKEPDIYIGIQCSIMINEFLTYMEKNINEFGMEITKTFQIKEEMETFHSDSYNGGSTEVPTGDMGIYDISKKTFVVISSEFYFHYIKLFEYVGDDVLDVPKCITTDWYCEYRKKFKSELLKTLEKRYNNENFELTIQKEGFTLNLR